VNVLLVTLDQFRGDCLSAAGHPVVRTPHLDRLAAQGVRLARHYSQAAPCAPGRACLYTGTYQMNNRVVANGTPLDDRFDNLARAARRAGFEPTLFGYTDQGVDPRLVGDPHDSRLSDYEGVLPGFVAALDLDSRFIAWRAMLAERGYELPDTPEGVLASEPRRPAEVGASAFLTDCFLHWLAQRDTPWFAHLSYWRPHPPYAAAGRWSSAYRPEDVDLPLEPAAETTTLHQSALALPGAAAPPGEAAQRALRAQYYGMIGDVDEQLGRLVDALQAAGQWEDTFIVVTSDHGDQLGDHGLLGKLGYFEQSYHVLGIVRDPSLPAGHPRSAESFTENVDVFPTICQVLGLEVPLQCDGLPLQPLLGGAAPPWWRSAASWEFDWRHLELRVATPGDPWDRRLERHHLTVRRCDAAAYVQFGDGSWCCFDLRTDPTWRAPLSDPARVLSLAQEMLVWRAEHGDRTLSDFLLEDGGIGRRPAGAPPAARP
jgi:arylsulfatase A-like enzyme